jgi:hypothetical protein
MEKELTFRQVIKKIKANIRPKEVGEICFQEGFSSKMPFYYACKKKDWKHLSAAQLAVIEAALRLIAEKENERKELIKKITTL